MASTRHVEIGDLTLGNDLPFTLIAGPCAMESRAHALEISQALKEITGALGIGLIYKSSFDKANRTSIGSNRGIGLDEALPIFAEVRETAGCPVLTDVHEREQCGIAAEAVSDPEALEAAPRNAPVRRLDEVAAARHPVLREPIASEDASP